MSAVDPAPSDPPRRSRRDPVIPAEEWSQWSDQKLLDLKLCQLGVTIEDTPLEARIAELQQELTGRGLSFQPHFWLSAEWFSPDGVPGVAIPFYLAHPRLEKLERAQMLEVEGGTPDWCMKILRHEAGHAIDNGYKLRLRRRRQQLFGPSYLEYPDYYTPKPYSKSFVLHLDSWYAQSHPDEDFAETFAVWLNPHSDWKARYVDWPALKKLEYMDTLMHEAVGQAHARSHAAQSGAASNVAHDPARALRTQAAALRGRASSLSRPGSPQALFGSPRGCQQHEGGALHRARTAATSAGWSPRGPANTSTRSIRSSRT